MVHGAGGASGWVQADWFMRSTLILRRFATSSERAQKEQLQNVKTILSKADDPLLPAGSVDAVLLLKTYHEVAQPVALLRNLRAALRPGAKVGVIDRNGNGEDHGVGRDVVIREAKEAGYQLLEQYDFVKGDKMDYFLVFTAEQ